VTPANLLRDIRSLPLGRQLALLVLPLVFLIVSVLMRQNAGPFWLWSNLDPDYWYLIDSLNMVNGDWPKHIAHPGTTVQWFGALIIKGLHPFASVQDINLLVLSNPEHYLTLIGRGLTMLNTVALIVVGMVGFLVFRDMTTALLLQMGPFLSKLLFKWSLHVSPEPLLVTTIIALSIVTVLALREGHLEKNRYRYAIAFAVIAGFGMATKITSAGLYLLPVLMLWNLRAIFLYAIVTVIATMIFTLPAAGSYGMMVDWITMISSNSGYFGGGSQALIDTSTYPRNLVRVSSRPMFFIVLAVALVMVVAAFRKCRRQGRPFPVVGRALAGLCLAFVGQAMLVAKHPAGHYMIPALTASALGLALIYQLAKEMLASDGPGVKNLSNGFMLLLLVLIVSQSNILLGLNRQFIDRTANAAAIDDTPYQQCAHIYFWPASHPRYALFMGSWATNYSFADTLDALYPDKSIMYFTSDGELHGLKGLRNAAALPDQYTCINARGQRPDVSLKVLKDAFSSFSLKGRCQSGDETTFTWGIDCQAGK
jgi:hypothetical protein